MARHAAIGFVHDLDESGELPSEAPCRAVMQADLGEIDRVPEDTAWILRQGAEISAARAHPFDRFWGTNNTQLRIGRICLFRHRPGKAG